MLFLLRLSFCCGLSRPCWFSVSSDMDERIYEKLDDVLLRRASLEKENDIPPPLPPKTHKRRQSEPAKTAPVEEGSIMIESSPNERHLRPYSMPADMTPCPKKSGTHVSPYGSITKASAVNSQTEDDTAAGPEDAAQDAPSYQLLENIGTEDNNPISQENAVSPADDDVSTSKMPEAREEAAWRRSHLYIALEGNSGG